MGKIPFIIYIRSRAIRARSRAIRARSHINTISNCCIQHKADIFIFRRRKSCFFHFLIHSVNALPKFLYIIILMQKCRDFRVTRKVNLTYIVQTDDAR